MEVQLGGSEQSSPGAFIGVGIFVLILGCVWPTIVFDDFTDEVESRSWDTVDASVNYMDIDSYEYECGDDETSSTCTQYQVSYTFQFEVDDTTYYVTDTEDVSYFDSRVWEVDYPANSTRTIAYDNENPENIDYNPGDFAPFIPPILVFLFTSLIGGLFIVGGIRLVIQPKDKSKEQETKGSLFDQNINFDIKKSIWGEVHYAHPAVEALAMKMKSFSCTDEQIKSFFEKCKTQHEQPNHSRKFGRGWCEEVEAIMDQHNSHVKYDFVGKIKIARFVLAGFGVVMLVFTLTIALPMFLKYDALDWYGWVLVWATLSPIGLIMVATSIAREMSKFSDQGLGEILDQYIDEEFFDEN